MSHQTYGEGEGEGEEEEEEDDEEEEEAFAGSTVCLREAWSAERTTVPIVHLVSPGAF